MKVLITGANGLLGQHLIHALQETGAYEILATARGNNRLKDQSGYRYASLDFTNQTEVEKISTAFSPDIILHAGAMTNVDECETNKTACWQANVKATQYLIHSAKRNNAFFLLLSTDFIFNGNDGPYDESALPDPLSYYGVSKLAAEMLLQECGLPWAIARTVLVYGIAEDLSRSNIILWVKKNLEEGKKIKAVTDQWRTPTLVQDLAAGCKLILNKMATGIFNISGKDFLTPYDMATATADYFGLDHSLIAKADASTFSQVAKRPAKTGFIIKKAKKELGYAPHSFRDGINIMADNLIKLKNR
jgi:dTDP-4-dehydrorhamnose reductase